MARRRTGIALALALTWAWGPAAAGEVTLGSAAAASGRYFGAALDPGALDEKPYRDLAARQLTSVTAENAMKWESVDVPIDGVSRQSHFVAGAAPTDLPAVMAKFASLGVDVAVTELDLRIRLPANVKSLAAQAGDYGFVVRACRQTPRCVGVTTWGITDDRSWIPSFFSGYGAALPFDDAGQPKPAFAAMIEAWMKPSP